MGELFSSTSYWIFFLLCMAIKSSGGCKEKSNRGCHFIPLLDTGLYTGLSAICIIIAAIAVVVLSIQDEWWYSIVLLLTFFILAPIAVMITLEPLTALLGNIITNIQSGHRFFVDLQAAREGCGISIWMILAILMELVFGVWMIVCFFQ